MDECVRCVLPGGIGVAVKLSMLPLFFSALVGGILLTRKIAHPKSRSRAQQGVAFFALITCVIIPVCLATNWPARYSPLVIDDALPFSFPQGCTARRYRVGDAISMSCKVESNALPRRLTLDHGFSYSIGRQEKIYYRVGDDAVLPDCNYFRDTCEVIAVERDVFHERVEATHPL